MDRILGISAFFVAIVLPVLTWLDFTPNGPHIVAKIRERLGERRRKQRDLEANMALLFQAVNELANAGIRQKNEVSAAIAWGEYPLTLAEFQAYRQMMDAKLEEYKGNQAALRGEVDNASRRIKVLAARISSMEDELGPVIGSLAVLDADSLKVGDNIRHGFYGNCVVLGVGKNSNGDAVADVEFENGITRLMVLKFANLEKF